MSWMRIPWVLAVAALAVLGPARLQAQDMIDIPGGRFVMGDAAGDANEKPRPVTVARFRVARHEVTNDAFAAFVAATGHVTDPERSGAGYVWTDRWRLVRGADWRRPHGPASTILGRGSHPVVQVSQRDARAYCRWRGQRLPREADDDSSRLLRRALPADRLDR